MRDDPANARISVFAMVPIASLPICMPDRSARQERQYEHHRERPEQCM